MAIKITYAIKDRVPAGADAVEQHTSLRSFGWINEQSQVTGETSREGMYDWIVNKNGSAYIRDESNNMIYVFGNTSPTGVKYIRTIKEKKWSDELLSLPDHL